MPHAPPLYHEQAHKGIVRVLNPEPLASRRQLATPGTTGRPQFSSRPLRPATGRRPQAAAPGATQLYDDASVFPLGTLPGVCGGSPHAVTPQSPLPASLGQILRFLGVKRSSPRSRAAAQEPAATRATGRRRLRALTSARSLVPGMSRHVHPRFDVPAANPPSSAKSYLKQIFYKSRPGALLSGAMPVARAGRATAGFALYRHDSPSSPPAHPR